MEAVASREELALKRAQGQMVDVDLVMAFINDMIIRTRNAIMSVPNRLSRKVADRETIALMKSEVARTLSQLSQTKMSDIVKSIEGQLGEEVEENHE
jgi:hypothetical protein